MKSKPRGASTSRVEVTNVSTHGIWLWIKGDEFFLPYKDYPWFKGATPGSVSNVKLVHSDHLHWPQLDVDLDVSHIGIAVPKMFS